MAFTCRQFHRNCSRYQSLNVIENYTFEITATWCDQSLGSLSQPIGPWNMWLWFWMCKFQTYIIDWYLEHFKLYTAFRWIPMDLADDMSTLVQEIKTWCHGATSHHLDQCWPRFMTPDASTAAHELQLSKTGHKKADVESSLPSNYFFSGIWKVERILEDFPDIYLLI